MAANLDQNHQTRIPLAWIDVAKGMGILAVVIGHSPSSLAPYIFWFHMPFFFILSGFLFKPDGQWIRYAKKKARHLLLPYVSFLLLLGLIAGLERIVQARLGKLPSSILWDDLSHALIADLHGGRMLGGVFSVFWFVTCLYLTQQFYNVISQKCRGLLLHGLIASFYLLAIWNQMKFQSLILPWDCNVVAGAIVYFHIGQVASRFTCKDWVMRTLHGIAIAIVVGFAILHAKNILSFSCNMRSAEYGEPGLSVLLACACSLLIVGVSKWVSNVVSVRNGLAPLGQASMVIMFLHNLFLGHLSKYLHSVTLMVAITVACCYAAFWMISKVRIGRVMLLGA